MEKKLYYLITSNEDLSITVESINTIAIIINEETHGRPEDEVKELEFIITPVFMTEDEFNNLPEAEN